MGHHYVPRYYLKGFTIPSNSDLIWRFERGTEKAIRTSTRNVAQENKLYSDEVEQMLAERVENPANIVLNKIRNFQPLNFDDKLIFSRYMMTMWKRVPNHQRWVEERAPEVIDKVVCGIELELAELKTKTPSNSRNIESLISKIRNKAEDNREDFIRQMWLDNIDPNASPKSIHALSCMTWGIMIAGHKTQFVTCDNPLFFFSWIGIGNPKSEVSFPISSNLALWAKWKKGQRDDYFRVRTQVVKEINRRSVSNASSYVFSSRCESWINILLEKEKIHLNRIT
jgi:hypothetical protein